MSFLKKEIFVFAAITLSLFPATTAQAQSEGSMVFAIDVIRHGDRGPIVDLASAPHQWPQGLGQLTPEGMNQEYQLGKKFHERYVVKNHLLPNNF